MESQAGGKALEKTTQAKLLPPSPTQPFWPDLTDHKRKKDQKGQEMVEGGKGSLSKEVEAQKGVKQAKVT